MWGGFLNGRLHIHCTFGVHEASLYATKYEALTCYEDARPVLVSWPPPRTTKKGRK